VGRSPLPEICLSPAMRWPLGGVCSLSRSWASVNAVREGQFVCRHGCGRQTMRRPIFGIGAITQVSYFLIRFVFVFFRGRWSGESHQSRDLATMWMELAYEHHENVRLSMVWSRNLDEISTGIYHHNGIPTPSSSSSSSTSTSSTSLFSYISSSPLSSL
jgi:hypothetical protein